MKGRMCVAGVGLILVGFAWAGFHEAGAPGTGALVPTESTIVWKGASDPSSQPVEFQLENTGSLPVRILGTTSGCGCAKPTVHPEVIEPGRSAVLSVQVSPIAVGERRVAIEVMTDSPATPLIPLKLVIVGSLSAPYMLRADGDLVFHGTDGAPEDTREILVETIEPVTGRGLAPEPRCRLPFLRIDPPIMTEHIHPDDPSLIGRTYRFPIGFTARPPDGPFAGEVTVADPWRPERQFSIRVFGRTFPSILPIPERILLMSPGAVTGPSDALLHIRTAEPLPDLRVVAESGETSPFLVERLSEGESARATTFRIRLDSTQPVEEDVYYLIARADQSGVEPVRIPVLVKRRKGDR